MNYLFTHAPLFVPGMKESEWGTTDLERRHEEVEAKRNFSVEETHERI